MSWIIVLDQGHIVEAGTHDVLIAAKGLYSALLSRQQLEEAMEREEDSTAVPALAASSPIG